MPHSHSSAAPERPLSSTDQPGGDAAQREHLLAALRQCRERFRAVADYTYDIESWVASDGRLLWVNPAVERVTGYTVDECLAMGDYPLPLIHEEDVADVAGALEGALSGTSGNDLPFRLRRRDGGSVWVAMSWQPTFADDGTGLGYRSSMRDIGDRKAAEEALVEEHRLLTSIIAHIPSDVYWKGRSFRYRGCNEAFARSAGVEHPEDIVGKSDYELAWEQRQTDYFRACDRRVMEENRPLLNIEEVERQADGRQAVLLTSKVPLTDAEGRVTGVLGIDTDISELKRVETELRRVRAELEARVQERTAELSTANQRLRREIGERERAQAALQVSEEHYRLVSELTSDYAYAMAVDAGGRCQVEWATDAFARVTGWQPTGLQGHCDWIAFVHPADRPVAERRLRILLEGRSTVQEFRVVTPDGQTRWLRDHARPIRDGEGGRVVRILGAAQDVSSERQAEEEARRHQAALAQVARLSAMGETAAQLAHEVNQPLCTAIGNAQTALRLLAAPEPDLDELRAALNDIVAFGEHGAAVIRRLRQFLQRQQPEFVVINVQRMIEEIAALAEADARQHECRVRFEVADDLPAMRGDSIQLQQVLLNLVHNGLEAMAALSGSRRELNLRARTEDDGGIRIEVSDTGAGFGEEAAARAFEPFYTTRPGGLGLGLAICRSVVEAHRGRLWIVPREDPGATLAVQLPGLAQERP